MIRLFWLIWSSTFIFCLSLQAQSGAQKLVIGEDVPKSFWDLKLSVMDAQGAIHQIDLLEYSKSELLIIDFWGYSCKACREGLDALNEIKKSYSDKKLSVLPIHIFPHELDEKYGKYIIRAIQQHGWSFPSVVNDDTLYAYFKEYLTGFGDVWIYKGKLFAIPEYGYLQPEVIKKVLSGQKVNMINQKRVQELQSTHELLSKNWLADSTKMWDLGHGVMGGRIQTSSRGLMSFEELPSGQRMLRGWNLTLNQLIHFAFSDEDDTFSQDDSWIEWRDKELKPFSYRPKFDKTDPIRSVPASIEWEKQYWFAYQLYLAPHVSDREAKKYMKQDIIQFLEQQFRLKIIWEDGPIRTREILRFRQKDVGNSQKLLEIKSFQDSLSPNSDVREKLDPFSKIKATIKGQIELWRPSNLHHAYYFIDATKLDPFWFCFIPIPLARDQPLSRSELNLLLANYGLEVDLVTNRGKRLVVLDR